MFSRRSWYSAGWSDEVVDKPLGRRILGEDLVLFRDAANVVRALRAVCAHRGGNLALGCVIEGAVTCPFHGWRYRGDGRCVRIPSQPAVARIPSRARVTSYPLVESQGILWIWMDATSAPESAPPRYEFLEPSSGLRRVRDVSSVAAAPFVSVVENAIDNSHPAFIHPRSLPGESEIVEHQLIQLDPDRRGFRAWFDPQRPWSSSSKGHQGWADLLRPFKRLSERNQRESYFRFDLGGDRKSVV